MTIDSNSTTPSSATPEPVTSQPVLPPDRLDGASDNDPTTEGLATQQALAALSSLQSQQNLAGLSLAAVPKENTGFRTANPRASLITLVAIAIIFVGLALNNFLIGVVGTLLALLLSLAILWPWFQKWW